MVLRWKQEGVPVEVWHSVEAQNVFLYVYVQTGVGNYAYRYRFTYGAGGMQEHSVFDTVSPIGPNLTHDEVAALF